jgi:hypothetical protein
VWRVEGLPFALFCVEAGVVGEQPGERLLYPFCRRFLREPMKMLPFLQGQERSLFFHVCGEVEQMRDTMDPNSYEDYKEFQESTHDLMLRVALNLPADVRDELLASLPVEERLKGLPVEERLKGLPAEERLKGLPAEERLKGLGPEDLARLRALLRNG